MEDQIHQEFNDSFMRVYKLPYIQNKRHTISAGRQTLYGFSWMLYSNHKYIVGTEWKSKIGSFEYVYGIYSGLKIYFDKLLSNFEPDDGEFICTFFILDNQENPIEVINSIILTNELQHSLGVDIINFTGHKLDDVSSIPEKYIEPLIFAVGCNF